jgi:hypothetical protein
VPPVRAAARRGADDAGQSVERADVGEWCVSCEVDRVMKNVLITVLAGAAAALAIAHVVLGSG